MENDFRRAEMEWLAINKSTLRTEHPGEWIAIGPEGLLANAPTMKELMELCSREGHINPFITGIPTADVPKEFFGVAI